MRTAIVTVDHDPDCENPLEGGGWTVHSFCSRHRSYKHPSELGLGLYLGPDGLPPVENIGLKRKLEVGTAFILSYYEHGDGCWSLRGEGPQCQFDSTQIAGLMVWEGKPKDCGWGSVDPDGGCRRRNFETTTEARAKNARATLEVYNEWCNGHCYYYNIKEYDEATGEEGEEIDSSSGFVGDKHLMSGLRDALQGTDVRIVKADGECAFIVEDELPLSVEPKEAVAV